MIDNTRKTYFSPEDDTLTAYLDFVKGAKKKIRIADYSFNLEPLVELLVQLYQQGVDIAIVLDKSQSGGATERPEVEKLIQANIPLAIGTSDKHKIMHDKFTVVDDEWVQSGSWNYTTAASSENNFFDIERNPERAAAFTKAWQAMYDWIKANED